MSSDKSSIVPVNGIILLNKADGLSSNRALQNVKKLIGAKKGGHGGSLDPAATGMLILCFGEATKICPYLLNNHKTYRVIAEFGKSTSTGDREGTIEETSEIHMHDHDYWVDILEKFLGESAQTPRHNDPPRLRQSHYRPILGPYDEARYHLRYRQCTFPDAFGPRLIPAAQ